MSLLNTELAEGPRWLRLGDAYEVTRKPRELDMTSLPSVPFAPMNAIPQGGDFTPKFTMRKLGEIRSGTYFERGDILLAKITPSFENGKQALVTDLPTPFGFATTEVIPLRPCIGEHDRRFLFFYLLHPDVRHHVAERMQGATGRQRIPIDVILDLPFPEFDPEAQSTIADSLEMIQRLKAIESQAVKVTTNLKRAAMHTLFTHGLRCEPQKETEIGPMPESWEVVLLGAFCVDTNSVDIRSEGDRTIQYVDVSSISREFLQIGTTSQYRLKDAPGRARKRILTGDVIFATVRPTLLRTAIVPEELDNQVCSTAFCVLRRDTKKMVDRFLYYVVQHDQFVRQLGEVETGASYPAVTDRMVKQQTVPMPSKSEQREIVAVLDAIDRKIDLHRRKLAVLEKLFKALLHNLITGKIRVSELDLKTIIDEHIRCNSMP